MKIKHPSAAVAASGKSGKVSKKSKKIRDPYSTSSQPSSPASSSSSSSAAGSSGPAAYLNLTDGCSAGGRIEALYKKAATKRMKVGTNVVFSPLSLRVGLCDHLVICPL